MRVLVVDDEESVRSALEDSIRALGYDCQAVSDGSEAWELVQAEGADTIITDWRMPGMDGLELCRRIRDEWRGPYTYIVMLTALDDEEHLLKAMETGADDFLAKPFSLAVIQTRLITAERVIALQRRREVHVRLGRRFARETDPDILVREVLAEALELVGAEAGGVFHEPVRKGEEGEIRPLWHIEPLVAKGIRERLAVQQAREALTAIDSESVVLQNEYQSNFLPEAAERLAPVQAAIAAPLRYEEQRLGALVVVSFNEQKQFSVQDSEALEQVANVAAAALIDRERARVVGALDAAQGALHESLGSAAGFTADVADDQRVPGELRGRASEVLHGVQSALGSMRTLFGGARQLDQPESNEEKQPPESR